MFVCGEHAWNKSFFFEKAWNKRLKYRENIKIRKIYDFMILYRLDGENTERVWKYFVYKKKECKNIFFYLFILMRK